MANVLSVIAAFIALIISIAAYFQTSSYNEKSLRPALEFQYKIGVGTDSSDSGYFKIVNWGLGPAKITKIEATLNGQSISTDAASLIKVAHVPGVIWQSLSVNSFIGPGEEKNIFLIKHEDMVSGCNDAMRRDIMEKLNLKIHYDSLFDYSDVLVHENYVSTNKREGCTVEKLN